MKLLDQYVAACEVRRLAPRTIHTYRRWVDEFLQFHHHRTDQGIRPNGMGQKEVAAFLTHFAVNRRVAESTQNQALGAVLFLCPHVLEKDRGSLDAVRANRPRRLPTVLSKDEVRRLFVAMPEKGAHRLFDAYARGIVEMEKSAINVISPAFQKGFA